MKAFFIGCFGFLIMQNYKVVFKTNERKLENKVKTLLFLRFYDTRIAVKPLVQQTLAKVIARRLSVSYKLKNKTNVKSFHIF